MESLLNNIRTALRYFLIVVIGFFIIRACFFTGLNNNDLVTEENLGWVIDLEQDKIRNVERTTFKIKSQNTFELEFPYGGVQRAEIQLIKLGESWDSAIFKIQKGHFACQFDYLNPCKFNVKFEDTEPELFTMIKTQDKLDQARVFKYSNVFIKKLLKRKQVVIEVAISDGGVQQFEFVWDVFDL